MVHQATPFGKHSSGNLHFKDTLNQDNSKRAVPKKQCRCLRKGCANRFLPNTANQKYCKQAACSIEIVRWASLKRQRKRRLDPAIQARVAAAQKRRRELNKVTCNGNPVEASSCQSDYSLEDPNACEHPIALSRCDCTRGDGTPLPTATAPRLVIAGPYRYVRNPMALAGIAQGVAVGFYLGSYGVIAYSLLGAIFWHTAVRPVEEHDLVERFDESYVQYRKSVRLWFPRLGKSSKLQPQLLSIKRSGET